MAISNDGSIGTVGGLPHAAPNGIRDQKIIIYSPKSDSLEINAGWSLISTDKEQKIDSPDTNIISDVWEYDNGYKKHTIAESLNPFKGYWIKCTNPGTIVFID
tara:strand:+ start:2243 stop:2551 length:309 start_codon:yes stop_codon:yes gene_type:complete